jgi:hypothetical protein
MKCMALNIRYYHSLVSTSLPIYAIIGMKCAITGMKCAAIGTKCAIKECAVLFSLLDDFLSLFEHFPPMCGVSWSLLASAALELGLEYVSTEQIRPLCGKVVDAASTSNKPYCLRNLNSACLVCLSLAPTKRVLVGIVGSSGLLAKVIWTSFVSKSHMDNIGSVDYFASKRVYRRWRG